MALPIDPTTQQPKPLKIGIDPDTMLMDEVCLFSGAFNPPEFRAFLRKYSNFTTDELHAVTRKEMFELWGQCADQIREALLPKDK